MADRDADGKKVPPHLRSLFQRALPGRASEAVDRVLGGRLERLETGRLGRALKISGVALKSGRSALIGQAKQVLGGAVDPEKHATEMAAELLSVFSEMRGVTMKLGQMLSYIDDAFPPEARRVLALLQRDVPPLHWSEVEGILEAELGRSLGSCFRHVEPVAVAAASMGQVHRAELLDGRRVAVKVQYPGIESAVRADLKNARLLGHMKTLLGFRVNVEALAAELEERFLDECDYRKEAGYQEAYGALFEGHPWVVVPKVHRELSGARVLTTDFHDGASFYEWLDGDPPDETRDRVARLLYRFYIGSFYLHGLFNCDPHPGNYLFEREGRVVFLDYGCARRYPPERLKLWIDLCRAVFEDDRPKLETLAVQVGFFGPKDEYDWEGFRSLLRYLYLPYLEDEPFDFRRHPPRDTFVRLFTENPNLRRLNMPPDAVFLNRIGFGLVSLLSRIGAPINCRRYADAYFRGVDPDWPGAAR